MGPCKVCVEKSDQIREILRPFQLEHVDPVGGVRIIGKSLAEARAQVAALTAERDAAQMKLRDMAPMKYPVLVACALIIRDRKVLLERHAPSIEYSAPQWDIPGGKVEIGETPEQAVVREIKEEMGVTVRPIRLLNPLEISVWTDAPNARHWVLATYECEIADGEPATSDDLQWIDIDRLGDYAVKSPDAEIINGYHAEASRIAAQELLAAAKQDTELLTGLEDFTSGVCGSIIINYDPEEMCGWKVTNSDTGHIASGVDLRAALAAMLAARAQEGTTATDSAGATTLCEDCPPVGYPTDKTRCTQCPRRAPEGTEGKVEKPDNLPASPLADEELITAIELFHSDGKPSGIWYCSECRAVSNDKHLAQRCHGVTHCETCGVSLGKRAPHYRKQCEECDRKDWRERQSKEEFERYTKAIKIAASEYTGPQVFFNDNYYPTVEDAIDECDEPPEYVWSAKNIGLRKATIEDLIGRVLEEAWEDADSSDLNGMDELQTAVDAFNAANSGIDVYMVDYKEAIVLDAAILEEWHREQGERRETPQAKTEERP